MSIPAPCPRKPSERVDQTIYNYKGKMCKWNLSNKRFLCTKCGSRIDKCDCEEDQEMYLGLKLNDVQLEYINGGDDLNLFGIPGGGKTTCIIVKMIKFDKYQKTNTIVLTFSRNSVFDFLCKSKVFACKKVTSKNARTFHSFCGSLYSNLNNSKNSSSLQSLIARTIGLLKLSKERPEILKNIEHIFVDEAQDMDEEQNELVELLREKYNIKISLVGDANQNIYAFRGSSSKYLLGSKNKSACLVENNRSTPEIVNLSNRLRTHKLDEMISTKPSGKKPYLFVGNPSQIMADILEKLRSPECQNKCIGIISPYAKSSNDFGIGLNSICALLEEENIEYIKIYKDSDDTSRQKRTIVYGQNKIYVSTIHVTKGLEYDITFMLNFHDYTMKRVPSQKDLPQYRNLWFVGTSRPKDVEYVYCSHNCEIWRDINKNNIDMYFEYNKLPRWSSKKTMEMLQCSWNVTDLVRDLSCEEEGYGNPYLEYEEKFIKGYVQNEIVEDYEDFNIQKLNISPNDPSEEFMGICVEQMFTYFYKKKEKIQYRFIRNFLAYIKNIEKIPSKYDSIYEKICTQMSFNFETKWTKKLLIEIENKINYSSDKENSKFRGLISYISDKLDNKEFICLMQNNYEYYFDKDEFIQMCREKIVKEKNFTLEVEDIFQIVLCKYQIEKRMKAYWLKYLKKDFFYMTDYLKSIDKYIMAFADSLGKGYKFQKTVFNPLLPIVGKIDVINNEEKKIIELTFSEQVESPKKVQTELYRRSFGKECINYSTEIWNLKKNVKLTSNKPCNHRYNYFDILLRRMKKDNNELCLESCVFLYDLETTGLERECDIIDIHIEEYTTCVDFVSTLVRPKMPIPSFITGLTGITNEMVSQSEITTEKLKIQLDGLLENCFNPIFIAYNGNKFDHKILFDTQSQKYTSNKFNQTCRKIDAINVIKSIFPEVYIKEQSNSLEDIHKRVTKKNEETRHRAKEDTKMIAEIFDNYKGLKYEFLYNIENKEN